MPDFDFRKHAGGDLPHDEQLADGVDAHWLRAKAGVSVPGGHTGDAIAGVMAHSLILNCTLNQHCPPAIVALLIAKLCEPVAGHTPEVQAEMREHVLHEVETMVDAIRRGDF